MQRTKPNLSSVQWQPGEQVKRKIRFLSREERAEYLNIKMQTEEYKKKQAERETQQIIKARKEFPEWLAKTKQQNNAGESKMDCKTDSSSQASLNTSSQEEPQLLSAVADRLRGKNGRFESADPNHVTKKKRKRMSISKSSLRLKKLKKDNEQKLNSENSISKTFQLNTDGLQSFGTFSVQQPQQSDFNYVSPGKYPFSIRGNK